MSEGIGQGSSFPWASSCTGLPAIVGSSTIEVTGKRLLLLRGKIDSAKKRDHGDMRDLSHWVRSSDRNFDSSVFYLRDKSVHRFGSCAI